MLKFDADTARFLELTYHGADFTRRRQASFDAIDPGPGETVLDIGCGNGMLCAELARAVGETGTVLGIDPSADMRRAAQERCREYAQVEILAGSAAALPVTDAVADKALSVQVFEYLEDLNGASQDAFRALRSGGLLAVGGMHFDTLAWFSDDPARMDRMIKAWDQHVQIRDSPAQLPSALRQAGFDVETVRPLTICDHRLKPDGLAAMMMRLMRRYAVDNGHVTESEAQAWFDEQECLAIDGRFFFSLTHFVVLARKP
jgi:SAM-dependent methyltransferase